MPFKKLILLFLILSAVGFVFAGQTALEASKTLNSSYDTCVNQYSGSDVSEGCKTFVDSAKNVSEILNTMYISEIDDDAFAECVKESVSAGSLNYLAIRDSCYNQVSQKNKLKTIVSLFKVNCMYDYNHIANADEKYDLIVSCKSILPSICFSPDVTLTHNTDTNVYNIVPIVRKSSVACYDLARIELTQKTFELPLDGLSVTIDSYKIHDQNDAEIPFENVLEYASLGKVPELHDIEKTYYDCLTNYYLHYKFSNGSIFLENGKIVTDSEMYENCKTRVTYGYAVYLDDITSNKKVLKDEMKSLFNDFLITSDLQGMQSFFDSILSKYDVYLAEVDKLTKSVGHLALNFDTGILIERLKSAIEDKSGDTKKEIIAAFKVTLLNDIEDKIEIRHKKNIPQLISFFDQETADISDMELQKIFLSLEKDIIVDMVDSESVLNMTDVDFTLTPGSLKIGNITIIPTKPMTIAGDVNLRFESGERNLVFSINNAFDISTSLPLSIKSNSLYISDKNIFLLSSIEKSGLPGKINKVQLLEDSDGFLVYVVEKQLDGYFLGLFKVQELVIESYNSLKGNLFNVDKPWWDFLIVYSKSVQEQVGVTS